MGKQLKTLESKLVNLTSKYDVSIEFRINRGNIVSIVTNRHEGHYIRNGDLKKHFKILKNTIKAIHKRQLIKDAEINNELKSLVDNKELFPEDLFD